MHGCLHAVGYLHVPRNVKIQAHRVTPPYDSLDLPIRLRSFENQWESLTFGKGYDTSDTAWLRFDIPDIFAVIIRENQSSKWGRCVPKQQCGT